ncbi:hypothetical protein QJQ45_014353, partial [Haematococcus lacustris]
MPVCIWVAADMRLVLLLYALLPSLFSLSYGASRARSWCLGGAMLCRGSTASQRVYDHTAVAEDGLVYMFGGRSGASPSQVLSPYLDEIDTKGFTVNALAPKGAGAWSSGAGRAGHSALVWTPSAGSKGLLLVFGGAAYNTNQDKALRNDLRSLDITTGRWTVLSAAGNASNLPAGRQYAGMALLGNDTLALYGGQHSSGRYLQDLWLFNLATRAWRGPILLQDPFLQPPAVAKPALLAVNAQFLVLFGGWTSVTNTSSTDTSPQPQPTAPAPVTPPPYPGTYPPRPPPTYPQPPTPAAAAPSGLTPTVTSPPGPPQPSAAHPSPPQPTPLFANPPQPSAAPLSSPQPSPSALSQAGRRLSQAPGMKGEAVSDEVNGPSSAWQGGLPDAAFMTGFDTTTTLTARGSLLIATLGGLVPIDSRASGNNQDEWKQFLATYSIANLTGSLLAGNVMPSADPLAPPMIPLTIQRTRLFTTVTDATVWQSADLRPVDLTSGPTAALPSVGMSFVRGASLVWTSGQEAVLMSGGMQEDGVDVATVDFNSAIAWPASGALLPLDRSLAPSLSVAADGTSSTYFRTMLALSPSSSPGSSGSILAYMGKVDMTSAAAPELTSLELWNTTSSVAAAWVPWALGKSAGGRVSKSPLVTPGGSWLVAGLLVRASMQPPANRAGYAVSSQQLSFSGTLADGASFTQPAAVLLLYGGAFTNGATAPPPRPVSSIGPASLLSAALQTCDTGRTNTA